MFMAFNLMLRAGDSRLAASETPLDNGELVTRLGQSAVRPLLSATLLVLNLECGDDALLPLNTASVCLQGGQMPLEDSLLERKSCCLLLHLRRQRGKRLLEQACAAQRANAGVLFGCPHHRFELHKRTGVARMLCHGQPEATVRRAMHRHQGGLVAQMHAIAQVAKGDIGIGRARVRDPAAGQIEIKHQST
jgi:hypothetical protein